MEESWDVEDRGEHSEQELADAGTGERAKQLEIFGPEIFRVHGRIHALECEKRVQSIGPHDGVRLIKAIPPYLKWAIWRVRPQRPSSAPGSLAELVHGRDGTLCPPVITRKYNLSTVPRLVGEVSYLHGELGMSDRRIAAALCDNAVRSRHRDGGGYETSQSHLIDMLGLSQRSSRTRSELAGSLWRLSRTAVHLNAADPLSRSWGTRGFFLLPRVDVIKDGRASRIIYDFPEPANHLIATGKVCTVDLHRIRAMRSAAAESLYLLLYDVAQWSNLTCVEYSALELVERLGFTASKQTKRGKEYHRWHKILAELRDAAELVYKFAQFLADFRVEGRGEQAVFTFYFTVPEFRKGHLPSRNATVE